MGGDMINDEDLDNRMTAAYDNNGDHDENNSDYGDHGNDLTAVLALPYDENGDHVGVGDLASDDDHDDDMTDEHVF